MLRKLSFCLFSLAAALNTQAYSMDTNNVKTLGMTVDYELVPNQPQVFINYMFWTVEATCTMISEDQSNTLYVVARAKKGKINDMPLSAGQSLELTVYPNEQIKLNADSGAKVEITNLGEHTLKASCTVAN